MQETWVQSLGREDPLQKEMATHSRILAWEIPWTEEPWGHKRFGRDLETKQQQQQYSYIVILEDKYLVFI